AYHFYAPEPGPPTLMWYYVKFEDGAARWVKIPRREDYRLNVEYQRRLSLTESINQVMPLGTPPQDVQTARYVGVQRDGIPLHPDVPIAMQYRPPQPYSKRMLESYARHVLRSTAHPTDPTRKAIWVKVYRVTHALMIPSEINTGVEPEA